MPSRSISRVVNIRKHENMTTIIDNDDNNDDCYGLRAVCQVTNIYRFSFVYLGSKNTYMKIIERRTFFI